MLKYLMAYNNHEYGSKSTYRQHMECLNMAQQSWVRQQEYIVNTWNA